MARQFSSISVETTLASGISNSQTTLTVATGTGSALLGGASLPAGNVNQFTLAIDPDTTNEEIVFATAIASDTFTISRGEAGSSAISHSGGATVRHVLTSSDLTFFNTGVTNAIPATIVNAKGDLIAATANDTVTRLAVGANDTVLTADNSTATGLKWVAPAVTTLDLTLNPRTANYTLVVGDVNKLVTMSDAGTLTLTVPSGVFTTGQQINVQGIGAGLVQIRNNGTSVLTSTGATSGAPNLRAQYSAATIICTSSNNFTVIGDLA